MSSSSFLGLGPGFRLAVEDDPAEADVEVLPNGLEAFNEGGGRAIRHGFRSLSLYEATEGSSPVSPERLIAGGFSYDTSGSPRICAVVASDAS